VHTSPVYRPHPRKRALRCTEGRREDRPSFLLFAVTGVLGGREGTAGGGGARWAPIRFGGVVRAGGTVASPLGSQRSTHGTTHLHSRPTPSWHRCTEGAGRNRASSFFLCAETGSWMEAVKGALGTNPRWRSCQSRWAVATVPWATDSMTDPTGHRSLPAAVHPQRDIDALRAPGEAPSFFEFGGASETKWRARTLRRQTHSVDYLR
jgi:hypothetical protein